MNTSIFRLNRLALLGGVAAAGLTAGTAMAQETVANASQTQDVIVVTGVRASLARALDQKRSSDGITDGISQEDIMDYPDLNIADALQRITGVTIERTLGEAQNIAVRGLASEFTQVTINGQPVVSGNLGREVDFDVFASELFTNVTVAKSHSAELLEGGLAGTVDLRTARPFDFGTDKPTFAFSAQGLRNDLSEKLDPRLSGLASNVFADGTIGVLASVSYSEQSLRQDNVEGLRFIQTDIDSDGDGVIDTFDVEYPFIPRYVNENILRERLGVTGAIQFHPSSVFEVNIDVAYADINETRLRTSIDGLIGGDDIASPLAPPTIDSTGLIVEATLPNVTSRSENIRTPQEEDLFLLNADASWDLGGNLTLRGKIGYSDASRTTNEVRSVWSSTGDFRYTLEDRIFLSIEGVGRNILDPSIYHSHQARFIDTTVTDEEFSAQSDFEWRTSSVLSAIKGGIRFSDRTKDTIQFDGRVNATANFADFATDLSDTNFFETSNAPTIIRNWPVINDFSAILNNAALGTAGFLPPQRLISTNTVEEETISGYVQGDIDTTIFADTPVRGNVGVRFVNTKQSATGFPTNDTQVTVSSDYTEVLPSANLTFALTDDLLLRTSTAKSLTRPTITDLTPGGSVAVGVNSASFGNPALSPFTAWNFDVSLEWYFADEGLFSVAFFDKEVDGFVTRVTASEVLDADVLGAGDPRAGEQFDVSRPVNGESSFVRGIEVGFQMPFSTFVGEDNMLSGFGVLANYTYVDSESEINFNGKTIQTLLRGQSRHSFNAIGYYEKGPFSLRLAYSWRDKYLDEIRTSDGQRSNFIDAYGQLDANIQYAISDNFTLTFDALNMLGEEQYRFAETTDRNIRFSETGRFYQFGIRARF